MKTTTILKKQKLIKILMVKKGYDMPGDKGRLARELGVSIQQLSMALSMYRITPAYLNLLDRAEIYLKKLRRS